MYPVMTTSQWLQIPLDVRHRIAKAFGLKKSSGSQIMDRVVISDGYTNKDLQGLNVESMQKYLNSDGTDFYKLLNSVITSFPEEKPPASVVEKTKSVEVRITMDDKGNPEAKIIEDKPQINEVKENIKDKVTEGENVYHGTQSPNPSPTTSRPTRGRPATKNKGATN